MIHSTWQAPSHSRLACFHQCKRRYFYSYILRLASKTEFPPAYAGSCGHAALDCWHRTGKEELARGEAVNAWGQKRFFGDWDFLTAGHLENVVDGYCKSKHTQDWEVVRLRRTDLRQDRLIQTDVQEDEAGYLVLAEASFVVDVPGMGPVNMRPDLLIQGASGLRIVDHKFSTSYLGAKLYNRAKFEHQMRLYALGMGALLGQPVLEGAVNGIYMGSDAIVGKTGKPFGGKKFDTAGPFDYTDEDFEETKAWYRTGVEGMREMHEHFGEQDELAAPQNPNDRCGYCDYASLCSKAPAFRGSLIKMNYARRVA